MTIPTEKGCPIPTPIQQGHARTDTEDTESDTKAHRPANPDPGCEDNTSPIQKIPNDQQKPHRPANPDPGCEDNTSPIQKIPNDQQKPTDPQKNTMPAKKKTKPKRKSASVDPIKKVTDPPEIKGVFCLQGGKQFYVYDKHERRWIENSRQSLVRDICMYKGWDTDIANLEICKIERHCWVDSVMHFPHRPKKMLRMPDGRRVLNISSVSCTKPKEGNWSVVENHLLGFVGVEGERERADIDDPSVRKFWHLMAWLHSYYADCLAGVPERKRGQTLVLIGEPASGKNLFTDNILSKAILGDLAGDGYDLIYGDTQFNASFFSRSIIAVHDPKKKRDSNPMEICKRLAANMTFSVNEKGRPRVDIDPAFRVIMTMNPDSATFTDLTKMIDSVRDKFILLHVQQSQVNMVRGSSDWKTFFQQIPAFLHWLINEFPQERPSYTVEQNERYGCTDYIDPQIREELAETSYAQRHVEIFQNVLFYWLREEPQQEAVPNLDEPIFIDNSDVQRIFKRRRLWEIISGSAADTGTHQFGRWIIGINRSSSIIDKSNLIFGNKQKRIHGRNRKGILFMPGFLPSDFQPHETSNDA